MRPLYILKIGGSVATFKDRPGLSVRKGLLDKIARSICQVKDRKKFDLVIIHGAGAAGHQLAKRYALYDGTLGDSTKSRAAIRCRVANQKLNVAVTEALVSAGLPAVAVHTASAVQQRRKKIIRFDTHPIKEALSQKCIPVMYGEMVFDSALGMTVCSGDTLTAYLAKKFGARKIFFASDIDGIFTQDPHRHPDAELIEKISWTRLHQTAEISDSHNTDVTGGLAGKISSLEPLRRTPVQTIEIFNGLVPRHYFQILLGEPFPHTIIRK